MLASATCEISKTLDELFSGYEGTSFAIRLWDGWRWGTRASASARCTLVLNSPRSLQALLLHPSEITLGEAFIAGDLDVEGDLFVAFQATEYAFGRPQGHRRKVFETLYRLVSNISNCFRSGFVHSLDRDRRAISHHYDQPAAFFRPWLGDSLVYSCAYFESGADHLECAQASKLELVCRKLRLAADDRFLDIGCGWGSLVLHAASQHHVYAQGITISQEQATVAAARIEAAKMTQSCRVDLLDYRLARTLFAPFNKIASLGMFEHVGVRNLPEYFKTMRGLLKPGGVFLNHGIARAPVNCDSGVTPLAKWIGQHAWGLPFVRRAHSSSFIDKYVFPDGELATISEAVSAAESAGFEVRDVENLREHYELTLRAWVANIQSCKKQIIEEFSETTYRTWLLYMAGSAAAFSSGDIAVYQTLLCRLDGGRSYLPLRRSDWYQPETGDAGRTSPKKLPIM